MADRFHQDVCMDWMQGGFCRRGGACGFLHPQMQQLQGQGQQHQQPQQQQYEQARMQQQPHYGLHGQHMGQHGLAPQASQWTANIKGQRPHMGGPMLGLHRPAQPQSSSMQGTPMQGQQPPQQYMQHQQHQHQQQHQQQQHQHQQFMQPAMQQFPQQEFAPAPLMQPDHHYYQQPQDMGPPQQQHHQQQQDFSASQAWPGSGGSAYAGAAPFGGGPPPPAAAAVAGRGPPPAPDRGRQPSRQLPPEPTEPAYKSRVWHKPLGDAEPPAGLKVRVMSYNLLADELAHEHRAELYYHTRVDHLLWPRRWSLIKEEIEHHRPDVLCLQEVDHWSQVRDELQDLGYDGQYLQRSGGRPDGCATLWRSSRFELVAVNRLNFSEFDLRDNVGLMTVLKNRAAAAAAGGSGGEQRAQRARGGGSRRRPGHRSRSARRVGSSDESSTSSESESGSSDEDRSVPAPRITLRAQEAAAAARGRERVDRRRHGSSRGSSRVSPARWDSSPPRKPRRLRGVVAAAAAEGSLSKAGQFVAVANTHVLFNPKRGDIKLAQLRLLLHHLQTLIAAAVPEDQAGHVAALIMGDFNSKPDTPLYRFMRQGWIDCLQHHRKDMAGNISSGRQQQQQAFYRHGRGVLPQHQQAQMLGYGMQQQHQQMNQMQQQFQQHNMEWPVQQAPQAATLQAQLQQNPAMQGLHHMQSQPDLHSQQQQQQQQQQGRGMHRSASAPVLTLRRLKQAGWTAEELITATGGAYNTHLRHFLQQHREQQLAELRQRRQQGGADGGGDGSGSGEEMDLTPDDAVRGHVAGTAPAWGQHPQQQQQGFQQAQGRGGGGYDSGEEMELSDSEANRQQRMRASSGSRGVPPPPPPQQQQQQMAPPPPPPPGTQPAADFAMQQASAGGVPPPPPPPAAAAAAAGQGSARPAGIQQQGRQQGGGGRGAQGRGGQRAGAQGRGGGQRGTAGSAGSEEFEIEEVPFFLKRAPAHRMDEPLPPSVGDGIARHELTLRSCYAELLGSEPEYTSCHDAFWGTVDFIFYTPQEGRSMLQPVAVLLPPEPETHLSRARCMPNATIPSDHISLVADLVLTGAGRQPGSK